MPIHFSIGFVVEHRPKRQVDSVCANANVSEAVVVKVKDVEYINVCWQASVRDCN